MNPAVEAVREFEFRDPERARGLQAALRRLSGQIGRHVVVMHVCGSHEQSIARFGLRSLIPEGVELIMGPGCPVCVTDLPEIDDAVALAEQGAVVATFGDMIRVPGSLKSLAEAKADGADVRVIYTPWEAVRIAEAEPRKEVVLFASGFETTAVTTAAVILSDPPPNLSVLSVHKYILPAMEVVAAIPQTRVQGFLAAGHAAAITGYGQFENFAARHQTPVVTAGFEPLDILSALAELLALIRDGRAEVRNAYPRCCSRDGNRKALRLMWEVFYTDSGIWRGIAPIPDGNLRIRPEWSHVDASRRFKPDMRRFWEAAAPGLAQACICGSIMSGSAKPQECALYGKECTPANPVGACMVSSEGTCKIWHQYGGQMVIRGDSQGGFS